VGFNSLVFMCNDAIGTIDRDPKGWWKRTWESLSSGSCARGWTKEYGHGNHANGFRAVWNQHADVTGIIIVGQNMAQVAFQQYGNVHFHQPEGQVYLLRMWADSLGYHLHKKQPSKLNHLVIRAKRKLDSLKGDKNTFSFEGRIAREFVEKLITHFKGLGADIDE